MYKIILLLTTLTLCNGNQFEVNPILTEEGYTIIKLENRNFIKSYSKILHVINLDKLRSVVDRIKFNIDSAKLQVENLNLLNREINLLENNLATIIPKPHRSKRGLINILGKGLKSLVGTMDSEDSDEIYNHLQTLDTNSKQLISQSNKQITINTQLIDSVNKMKNIINEQNDIIENFLTKSNNKTNQLEIKIHSTNLALNFYTDVTEVNKIITEIKDNILLSKLNVPAHDILTKEEMRDFNITIDLLPFIKNIVLLKDSNTLIFALSIPKFSECTYFKAYVIPFPNSRLEQLVDTA
uniref:Putative retrovirus-related env polyprotein from transposon n=1 Tax=Corethrella appendiculata TaxID=1370023 RepID=U5ETB3_9DIPT